MLQNMKTVFALTYAFKYLRYNLKICSLFQMSFTEISEFLTKDCQVSFVGAAAVAFILLRNNFP